MGRGKTDLLALGWPQRSTCPKVCGDPWRWCKGVRSPVIQRVLDFAPHLGQGCHDVGAHTEWHTEEIELLAGWQIRLAEIVHPAEMLQHSEDQIGLYGGWGADKPIVQVNMETDHLGTPYRLGKFPRGGGQADLVHSTIDHEPEVFLYRLCHGDVQICILYVNGHNPFALFDGWPDSCLGFHLELQMTRWSFRWERSMTRHRSPGVFGTRKKRDSWRNPSFLDRTLARLPLDWTRACSLLSTSPGVYSWCWRRWICESVEVVTPAPTRLSPRVHDARQLPSRLCRW